MTARELRMLIEHELLSAELDGAEELAGDLAELAAVGLVEIAPSATGELRIAPRHPDL